MIKEIIKEIYEITNSQGSNEEKHDKLAGLWTEIWKRSGEDNFPIREIYNLYLCSENTSFIINQKPISKKISDDEVARIIGNFRNCGYFEEREIEMLLDWDVGKVRKGLSSLGINIIDSSLNGFCELAQVLSIKPFEQLGLMVTKNRAGECFDYPLNHLFGTVTFPVLYNNVISEKTYLIDVTYRQFFSTIRCNEGMYYVNNCFNVPSSPDPGYFVKDENFAKKLMGKGFVELNWETAKKYGEPFYLAGLKRGEISNKKIDYLGNIFTKSSDYAINDLEGLGVSFPTSGRKI